MKLYLFDSDCFGHTTAIARELNLDAIAAVVCIWFELSRIYTM